VIRQALVRFLSAASHGRKMNYSWTSLSLWIGVLIVNPAIKRLD
jgi:hypothetical protein